MFEALSIYNQFNDSVLLDETSMTYRHYLQVNGTFNNSTKASCIYSVNGYEDSDNYSLQGLINITILWCF